MDNISKIFPNMAAELDEDLGNVRIQLDSQQKSQEDELLEYFGRYNLEEIESTTPISDPEIVLSKKEFPENKVLDIEHMFNNAVPDKGDNLSINSLKSNNITNNENKYQDKAASPVNLQSQHPTDWYLKLKTNHNKGQMEKNKITSYNSSISEINCTLNSKISTSGLGSDKWVSEKEKFLENSTIKNENYVDNTNRKENQKLGAVMIKESFIELPRIGRISRSFHGKSPSKDSYLEIDSTPRRASDNMVNLTSTFLNSKPLNLKNMDLMQGDKSKHTRPKFCTQKSQPCPVASKEEFRKSSLSDPQNLKGARFTTTIVDESAFMENFKSNSKNNK